MNAFAAEPEKGKQTEYHEAVVSNPLDFLVTDVQYEFNRQIESF